MMFKKLIDWFFPKKIKMSELPETCQTKFFLVNAGFGIGAFSALILSIVQLSYIYVLLVLIFGIGYLSIYMSRIRPFLNDEVLVIEGKIIKDTGKREVKKNALFELPKRRFVTINTSENFCEVSVEDNFSYTIGDIVLFYVNPKDINKRNDNVYRISDYYLAEVKAYEN